jgi:hypothetical protein
MAGRFFCWKVQVVEVDLLMQGFSEATWNEG